ncbi:MAG: Hdr-like menaquinol oxidoreductase cytochrome c subunit [Bacteroidota bacterium]
MLRTRLLAALLAVFSGAPFGAWATAATPQPEIVIERPGNCLADRESMRRNHPAMLRHQRDRTLREGIRGEKVSLNGCISCHAGKTDGSVLGSQRNFCQSCHSYAAVRIDCFECHQAKPGKGPGEPALARGEKP